MISIRQELKTYKSSNDSKIKNLEESLAEVKAQLQQYQLLASTALQKNYELESALKQMLSDRDLFLQEIRDLRSDQKEILHGRNNSTTSRNKSPSKRNRSKSPRQRNSCPPHIQATNRQHVHQSPNRQHTDNTNHTTGYNTDISIHTIPDSADEMNYPADTDDDVHHNDQRDNRNNSGFNGYFNKYWYQGQNQN